MALHLAGRMQHKTAPPHITLYSKRTIMSKILALVILMTVSLTAHAQFGQRDIRFAFGTGYDCILRTASESTRHEANFFLMGFNVYADYATNFAAPSDRPYQGTLGLTDGYRYHHFNIGYAIPVRQVYLIPMLGFAQRERLYYNQRPQGAPRVRTYYGSAGVGIAYVKGITMFMFKLTSQQVGFSVGLKI